MPQSKRTCHNPATAPRILVVGDIMLDHYRIGDAPRISPEAPVPVLLNPRSEFRLGGAAAVATMCATLGAQVSLTGVLGDDPSGQIVRRLLQKDGVTFTGAMSANRVTTTKERVVGIASGRHQQQLARIDQEQTEPLDGQLAQSVIDGARGAPQIVLIADYAKGVCCPQVIAAVQQLGVEVLVDPPRDAAWTKYRGCTAIIPNRQEAADYAPRDLLEQLALQAVIVKRDQDGAELFLPRQPSHPVAAHVRQVHDVTGAGDQFLAVLGYLRAIGSDWLQALIWANGAAGLQVEKQGCVPVTWEELNDAMRTTRRPAHPVWPLASAG